MTGPIGLVVFDCDGVLIDSEVIFCRADAEALRAAGFEITAAEIAARFTGVPTRDMLRAIEDEQGRSLPEGFVDERRVRLDAIFERELRATDGVHEVVDALDVRSCVASSSTVDRLERNLRLTGLYDRFSPHIFSSEAVEKGKPAPDLFLFAAASLGVEPKRCLVVEDSVAGITAARAAEMCAIGFVGGGHCDADHPARLERAGAERVLSDLRELPALVAAER
jgi:HAD superfamily hydrolase (TIGR01509 family)